MIARGRMFFNLNYLIVVCGIITVIQLNQVFGVDYYTEKLPFLPSCRIYEPDFTKCSTNSMQKFTEQLVIGIPKITAEFGIFDPLNVKNVYFKQDNNEVASIRANLTQIIVKGFSKVRVKQHKVSKKDFSWDTKIFLPKLRVDAHYTMDGRMLFIPLGGSGELFNDIENLDISMRTKIRLYEKGGFTFNNVTSVHVNLNMTNLRSHFSNLFNGRSKEIERSTNEFFNKNWRDIYEALEPIIIETVENILFDILHKSFSMVPANFFIEDIPTSEQLYGKKNVG